ncbi:hypothetical protein EJB05_38659, partial [Eragrostis curvula]
MAALWPLVALAATAASAAATASRLCPTSCGSMDISYPFGIGPACSLPGFNLTCDSNTYGKHLRLGSPNATVDYMKISASGSISALAVHVMRSVRVPAGADAYTASWESPGRPFAISGSSNMSLFVLGCGVTAALLDRSGAGAVLGKCSVVCASEQVMERLPEGLCAGIGCCRIDVRVPLRAFTLNITRSGTGGGVSRDRVTFLVTDRDGYTFTPGDLDRDVDENAVASAHLDWAIPDRANCSRAAADRASYACVSNNSECQDLPIGGYVCHCIPGFSGNAYVVDGCVPNQVYGSNQPKRNCPTTCGNVSVPFPFGTELGCFARIHLYLACNPGPIPPVLQMTQHSVVTDISIDDGTLRIQKLSDPGDFLEDRDSTFYAFSGESGVLKWVVDNTTCKEVTANNYEHRCVSVHSECIDVTDDRSSRHVGYRCKCSSGFQGNPYMEDGCRDIDECLQLCHGVCQNSIGSFACTPCPHGTEFDAAARKCKASSTILGITIGLSSGGGLIFVAAIVGILHRRWKKGVQKKTRRRYFRKNKGILLEQLISSDQNASDGTKIFSLDELEKATNNFDQARVVGRGGHGTVYKGILTDQRVVAIKRSSKLEAGSEIEEFINEVSILSQINHRNVVKLHGCCLESEVPLLVYEFVSNGTLYDLLHRERNGALFPLPWEERLRIAVEVAGALTYLHSAASVSILHRDVKCMNVLLNDSYTAKVSDFGASRSIPIDQTHLVTAVQGTFGYLDPEYYHTSQLNEKSDVYSFGVILLELLTRKKPIFENENGEKQNLSNYFVWAMGERPLEEVVDMQILGEAIEEVIASTARLAEECLSLTRGERPTMKDVEMRLQMLRARHAVAPGPVARSGNEATTRPRGRGVPVPADHHVCVVVACAPVGTIVVGTRRFD